MGSFYQIVHARVDERTEGDLLDLRPAFVAAMRRAAPGLVDAELVRLDDGTWLDIVRWESRGAAEAGASAHARVPEAGAMAHHIREIIGIQQGDAVDLAVPVAEPV